MNFAENPLARVSCFSILNFWGAQLLWGLGFRVWNMHIELMNLEFL